MDEQIIEQRRILRNIVEKEECVDAKVKEQNNLLQEFVKNYKNASPNSWRPKNDAQEEPPQN